MHSSCVGGRRGDNDFESPRGLKSVSEISPSHLMGGGPGGEDGIGTRSTASRKVASLTEALWRNAAGAAPSGAEEPEHGWSAHLNIRFEPREISGETRTVVTERDHFGPLRILKPLYPEGHDICHGIVVHPPGGIVAGDSLAINVQVDQNASAVITTPGAQKWYRSTGKHASALTQLDVADAAALEWMPQESIVFDGTSAQQSLVITLAPEARFFGWDMLCLGRTACGERFRTGEFRQRIRLVRAGTGAPLWRESMVLVGDDPLLTSPLGLRGMPVTACAWIVFSPLALNTDALLADVRTAVADYALAAASAPEPGLIVVKAIGEAPETVRNLLIGVWSRIRMQVFGRKPSLPRIWST